MNQFIFENLKGSGITEVTGENPIKVGDPNWRENGVFGKFN